jgi:hypothetical protein
MKSYLLITSACAMLLSLGCSVQDTGAERTKENREAQVRAEAVRKEMETLPKAFQTPDFFRKNEPEKKAGGAPVQKQPKP